MVFIGSLTKVPATTRYKECNIKGEETEKLCPDGLVFEEKAQHCDYPSKVVCGNRTKLRKYQ